MSDRARGPVRLLAAAAVGAVALGVACTELPTGTTPFAIEFLPLPSPGVVIGDTLRNEAGVATPLRAVVFDGSGDTVHDARVRFVALDAGVRVDTVAGWVVAGSVAVANVRLQALANGVPAMPQMLGVVPRPDSLALVTTAPDTVRFDLAGQPDPERFTVTSSAIQATVLSGGGASAVGVPSWLVRYTLEYHGSVVPERDSTRGVWLVDGSGRASAVDTTDGSGISSRQVRVRPILLADGGAPGADSVTVVITSSQRGQRLLGADYRVVLPIRSPR